MLDRILVYLLIPALILLTLPQDQWHNDAQSPVERSVADVFQALLLGVNSGENDLFVLTRNAPDEVAPGEVFTVTEELQAKVQLEFAALVSSLPVGFELTSGELRKFQIGMNAGEVLTNQYEVRAPDEEGTFTLLANARAKPAEGESQGLSVDLTITVTSEQPPPPPPPPNEPPIAIFSFTPVIPKVGEVVTFDASASIDPDGTITNYRWDLGDGTVLEGPDQAMTTHVYESAGTFQVTLVVVDDQGAESLPQSLTIVVEELPPPSFLGIPLNILIIAGAVVGGVIAAILIIRAITRGAPTPPAEMAKLEELQSEIEQFLQITDLPLREVSSLKAMEGVDEVSRASWVRTLVDRSLIIVSVEEGSLILKEYEDLSPEELAQLDVSALGVGSLVEFVSAKVEPGDTIVSITWITQSGDTFESLAVVDPQGQLKYDTFMDLVPVALAGEL